MAHLINRFRRRSGSIAQCSHWDDHGLVFCSDRGTPVNPSNLYKAIYRFLEGAGIDRYKFHKNRHTNITEAARAGVNLKALQTHAGHADFSMTASYMHVAVQDEHALAGAVAGAFAPKRKAR